jgi:curved DNA-binding protein CbpA
MVQDHFAMLGVSRAPWLDPEELKTRFLAVSAETHPDKATAAEKQQAEENFKKVNEAYNFLRNSRSRLIHLLELTGLPKPGHVEALPPVALELFAPVATVTKRADTLLKEKAHANSPMLKVQWFQRGLECVDELQKLQDKVQQRITQLEEKLQELNSGWQKNEKDPTLRKALQDAAAAFGFLERWRAQLQERAAALSF